MSNNQGKTRNDHLKWIILKTKDVSHDRIVHSQPKLDRCCKSSGWDQNVRNLKFDTEDNIPSVFCSITKHDFFQSYVKRRKPVILTNCTDSWRANDWSFESEYEMEILV